MDTVARPLYETTTRLNFRGNNGDDDKKNRSPQSSGAGRKLGDAVKSREADDVHSCMATTDN